MTNKCTKFYVGEPYENLIHFCTELSNYWKTVAYNDLKKWGQQDLTEDWVQDLLFTVARHKLDFQLDKFKQGTEISRLIKKYCTRYLHNLTLERFNVKHGNYALCSHCVNEPDTLPVWKDITKAPTLPEHYTDLQLLFLAVEKGTSKYKGVLLSLIWALMNKQPLPEINDNARAILIRTWKHVKKSLQ